MLALAVAAVALLAGWSGGRIAAQTNDISVEMSRVAVLTRGVNEPIEVSPRSLPNEATISGPVTVRVLFGIQITAPTLSSFSATNATLSNLRTSTWSADPPNRGWMFDLTPTADGAVTVSIAAGTVSPLLPGVNRSNEAASFALTAALGAPKPIWMGFSSPVTRTLGPYYEETEVDLTVTFNEHVTVVGSPTVALRLGASAATATYESGSGSAVLRFRFTVPSGWSGSLTGEPRVDTDSITLPSGASIQDGGGTNATLTLPPRITRIESRSRARLVGEPAPTWGSGSRLSYKVFFSEAVTVTLPTGGSTAYIQLRGRRDGGGNVDVRAVYASGSGSDELTFTYTWSAADSLAATSSLFMREIHLFVPDGVGIRNAAGIDIATQRPGVTSIRVATEGTQVQAGPRLSSGPSADLRLSLSSNDAARASLNPTSFRFRCVTAQCVDVDGNTYSNSDTEDWQRSRTLTITLEQDADLDDNRVDLSYTYNAYPSGLLGRWDGATGTWMRLLIEDDDPELDAITAAASITEGQNAEFTVTSTAPPAVEDRAVRATISQTGNCLASSVTDVDTGADGIQVDIELQTSGSTGSGTLSLPTVDDSTDELNCVLTVTLTPPAATDVRFFAIAGGAASLSRSITVQDNDDTQPITIDQPEPPEGQLPQTPVVNPPGVDDPPVEPPQTRYPPELEAQTIVEGQSVSGEINITKSDRPQADVEFNHRFVPAGVVDGTPDPVTFVEHRWWERKSWTLAARHDADSDDERVRWHLSPQSDDLAWRNIYVHYAYVTVRDDDPQVSALDALQESVTEGQTATFRLTLAKPPLDGARSVRVTLTTDGDMLADGLTDADENTPGLQLDLSLARTLEGESTVLLRLATDDDDQDEPDGALTVTVSQPSNHTADNYFTLAGDATQFTAAISVLDNDEPEAPVGEEAETLSEIDDPSEGEEQPEEEDTPQTDDPSKGEEQPEEEDTPPTDDPSKGEEQPEEEDTPPTDDPSEGEEQPGEDDAPPVDDPSEGEELPGEDDAPQDGNPSEGAEQPGEDDAPPVDDPSEGEEQPGEEDTPSTDDPSEGEELPGEDDAPQDGNPSEGAEQPGEDDAPPTDDPSEGEEQPGEDDAPPVDDPSEGEEQPGEEDARPVNDPSGGEEPTDSTPASGADEPGSDEDPPLNDNGDDPLEIDDPAENDDPPKGDPVEEGGALVAFPNTGSGGLASPPVVPVIPAPVPVIPAPVPVIPAPAPVIPAPERESVPLSLPTPLYVAAAVPVIPAQAGIQTQPRSQRESPEPSPNTRLQGIPVRCAVDKRCLTSSFRWNDGS